MINSIFRVRSLVTCLNSLFKHGNSAIVKILFIHLLEGKSSVHISETFTIIKYELEERIRCADLQENEGGIAADLRRESGNADAHVSAVPGRSSELV